MFRDKEILKQVLKQELILSKLLGEIDKLFDLVKSRIEDLEEEIRTFHEIQEENRIEEDQLRFIIKDTLKNYADEIYQDYLKEAQKKCR